MSAQPRSAAFCAAPTPTTYMERRGIALSLLNHRPASGLLCELVIAAMQGKSLMQLVEMEAARTAVVL